tara:strand:+ start:452 stop:1078 length:627 start_codon:yes stop_codon:yes gene_type:complete
MYKLVETQTNSPGYQLMSAGINESVSLVDVTFDSLRKDGTGGNVIRFYFQDDEGAKFTQTYMEVTSLERLKESAKNAAQAGRAWSSTPEQLHGDLIRNVGESLYHILTAFIPKDKVSIGGDSWEELGKNLLSLVGRSYDGLKFKIRCVYDKQGKYLQFPNRPLQPFILPKESTVVLTVGYRDNVTPAEPTKEVEISQSALSKKDGDIW